MRVLKWGEPFEKTTYKAKCLECGTKVQFCEGEAGFSGTCEDGYFLEVKCPNCAGPIYHCVHQKVNAQQHEEQREVAK